MPPQFLGHSPSRSKDESTPPVNSSSSSARRYSPPVAAGRRDPQPMSAAQHDLRGKVALVTGGSRGLGGEIVRAFAAGGADVVVASRKLDACEQLAAEVEQRHGHAAVAVACNVSDWAQCDYLADAAYECFGRVDVLVNNAGLSPL